MPFADMALIIGAASLSTMGVLVWLSRASEKAPGARFSPSDVVSFLFDDDVLHHASDKGVRLHKLTPGHDRWHALQQQLVARFPDFPDSPHSLPGTVTLKASQPNDLGVLHLSQNGNYTEVQVQEPQDVSTRSEPSDHSDLCHLQRASDTTPHPVWQCDGAGQVIWHNKAYDALFRKLHNDAPRPDALVFSSLAAMEEPFACKRVSAQSDPKARTDWYDVSAIASGDVTVYHAIDVNAVVRSEAAQRNFVQTLAKTFAQLSIGLAIFDRNGQLALFNPALIDLTNLPADFLSARPTLISFFDRLRENRKMPEPKNYSSWRQEITDVIAAATDGRYQETWTLETGQTYRVHGRPHPDGAIAFLIEDISAEVSLTRNFRAELELGQSLMDTFDEALVVFSPTGVLTFCNLAYRTIWGL